MSPLEYRQTRAAIRDRCSIMLDELDAFHAALTRGEAEHALTRARALAMASDDLTALCERVVRHFHMQRQADTERYAHGVK